MFIVLNVACAIVKTMPTVKHVTLNGGAFDQNVEVYISRDTAAAVVMINREQDLKITAADLDARGVTFTSENGSPVVIWLPSTLDNSVVAHELTHASIDIMRWASVPLTNESEETYAYMMQYLTKQLEDKTK